MSDNLRYENRAIQIVIEYEKRNGRDAIDVRHNRINHHDVESPERPIEVKYRAKYPMSQRAIWLNSFQFEEFLKDPKIWLYVVNAEGRVFEIPKESVLAGAKHRPRWRIYLKRIYL